MNRHLTNDELLDRLYGLGEAEGETNLHLKGCAECADRWRAFELRREETAAWPEVSSEFLAAQRRGIYARLEEHSGGMHVRWAPALAAGFLLAAGVYLAIPGRHAVPNRPAPVAHVVHAEMTDEQLFSDVYSMEQSAEPRAAVPMHALFTASEGPEEQ
jgi:hypothetical protein